MIVNACPGVEVVKSGAGHISLFRRKGVGYSILERNTTP